MAWFRKIGYVPGMAIGYYPRATDSAQRVRLESLGGFELACGKEQIITTGNHGRPTAKFLVKHRVVTTKFSCEKTEVEGNNKRLDLT